MLNFEGGLVTFPGDGRDWDLPVADKSAPIWQAVAQIMASEPYLFREQAGGTYNCRPPSLHAYGLALDLNPSVNPFRCPMTTDMPASFVARMEGIRANGKQALQWGGRWPCENPPDPMHFQINLYPSDCVNITWDQGGTEEGDMWNYFNINETFVRNAWDQGWLLPKTQATLDYFLANLAELQKGSQSAVRPDFQADWLNFRRAVSNGIALQKPGTGTVDQTARNAAAAAQKSADQANTDLAQIKAVIG